MANSLSRPGAPRVLLGKGRSTDCYNWSSHLPSLLTKKGRTNALRARVEEKKGQATSAHKFSPQHGLGLFPLFLCSHFLSISLLLHCLFPLPFTHSVQPLATFLALQETARPPSALKLATEEKLHPSALITQSSVSQIEKMAVVPFTPPASPLCYLFIRAMESLRP